MQRIQGTSNKEKTKKGTEYDELRDRLPAAQLVDYVVRTYEQEGQLTESLLDETVAALKNNRSSSNVGRILFQTLVDRGYGDLYKTIIDRYDWTVEDPYRYSRVLKEVGVPVWEQGETIPDSFVRQSNGEMVVMADNDNGFSHAERELANGALFGNGPEKLQTVLSALNNQFGPSAVNQFITNALSEGESFMGQPASTQTVLVNRLSKKQVTSVFESIMQQVDDNDLWGAFKARKTVKILLEAGADPDLGESIDSGQDFLSMPIYYAARREQDDWVRLFWGHNATVRSSSTGFMKCLVQTGDSDLIKRAVDAGFGIDSKIFYASCNADHETFRYIYNEYDPTQRVAHRGLSHTIGSDSIDAVRNAHFITKQLDEYDPTHLDEPLTRAVNADNDRKQWIITVLDDWGVAPEGDDQDQAIADLINKYDDSLIQTLMVDYDVEPRQQALKAAEKQDNKNNDRYREITPDNASSWYDLIKEYVPDSTRALNKI